MKTFYAIVLALGLLTLAAFGQPTVTQVSNAASEALAPLPNSPIAPGSFFSIYGTGFGPDSSTCGSNFANCAWGTYPLPLSIGNTSVTVTVGGSTVTAILEFAANFGTFSQVNAVLPSNTPAGDGTLTVTSSGTASNAFPITVVPMSFGTFTVNLAGTGPGDILDINYNVTTPFVTIKPGGVAQLFGTGLGAVDASTERTAPPAVVNICAVAASCPVTVWVGGFKADVLFAGRSGYTAEDQIDFTVPSGVVGCYVQVAVQTGSVISNFTSMSVDPDGGICKDSNGVDYNDIAAVAQANGKANVGAISLLSNYLNLDLSQIGLGNLQFDNDTVSAELGTFTGGPPPQTGGELGAFQGFTLAPSVNNCSVSPFVGYPPPIDPVLLYQVTYPDAGATLSITGPDGTQPLTQNCGKDASGNPNPSPCGSNGKGYSGLVGGSTITDLLGGNATPPFFLTPAFAYQSGTYTVSGSGGPGIGSFSVPITVSSAAASFQWTNQNALIANPIPRDVPLEIDWTGGDPNGYVDITLIASTLQKGFGPPAPPAPPTPGILVECIAPTSLGKFTVPTYVLQSLPSTITSQASVPPGELLVGPASPVTKGTAPTGLDALYIFYHFIQGANVVWN